MNMIVIIIPIVVKKRYGREGHYSSDCYATKHIKGYWLD